MKRILKIYTIITTICFCVTLFLVGIITAENNSRRLSFGEQYEAVEIYNTNSNKLGISTNDRYFELSMNSVKKGKKVANIIESLLSPVINNLNWVIKNITNIINKS